MIIYAYRSEISICINIQSLSLSFSLFLSLARNSAARSSAARARAPGEYWLGTYSMSPRSFRDTKAGEGWRGQSGSNSHLFRRRSCAVATVDVESQSLHSKEDVGSGGSCKGGKAHIAKPFLQAVAGGPFLPSASVRVESPQSPEALKP